MIAPVALVPSTDAARWLAVRGRDVGADGDFVYAVTSTRVYCRPSCPSRRPRPDRVRYYADPDAAEAAGFRACRRCHPRDTLTSTERAVQVARSWIDAHPGARPSLARLSRVTGLSPWHLQRVFTKSVGLSPREYARARRATALKRELRRTSVTDAIYAAGFGSSSRVYEEAPAELGMTPGAYRRGGRGERIAFGTAVTPVGVVLAAATSRGLCKVALGDDAAKLEEALKAEFPGAEIVRDRNRVSAALSALREAAAGRAGRTPLPIDVAATAFQRRVWRALQAIPAGQTRTYAEVARSIGRPTAARAVARACASNPVALVVPCHRVVPAAGGAGGYRWGSERKEKLLAREAGRVDAARPVEPR
jgi:AraC family transcriptional regulator of adaptative response/methylated-DNA-[protein]-cysteine methyltransferase